MTDGLLLVDKPRGWTSHDVVALVRRILPSGTKVGHSGTLDPRATGLLILLVGRATKFAADYQRLPKVYSGAIHLGLETDTWDLDGKTLKESPVPELSACDLQKLFDDFLGAVELPIPPYSAIKHKGRPLYEYARKGEVLDSRSRLTHLFEWTLISWESPEAVFRVRCSSGTYVRSLAVAAGRKLGCGAALSSLRRESVGSFSVEDALTMERLRGMPAAALEGLVHV